MRVHGEITDSVAFDIRLHRYVWNGPVIKLNQSESIENRWRIEEERNKEYKALEMN